MRQNILYMTRYRIIVHSGSDVLGLQMPVLDFR